MSALNESHKGLFDALFSFIYLKHKEH